jgi:hypothetical protein
MLVDAEIPKVYADLFRSRPNEETGILYFLALVRNLDFKAMHQVASQIYKVSSNPKYLFWAATSTYLQVLRFLFLPRCRLRIYPFLLDKLSSGTHDLL